VSEEAEPTGPEEGMPPRLAEFARQARDLVDRALRTPEELWSSCSGAARQVAPIDSKFRLDHVILSTNTVLPEIHIFFRWGREQTLFGVRESVGQDDDLAPAAGATDAEELASLIMDSLAENLLAVGYGMKNAIREPQDGVTWLHWERRH
jgi:hypothetical protein